VQAFIDVDPEDSSNSINLKAKGKVQVAIFSLPTFDPTRLAVDTIHFGGSPVAQNPHGKFLATPIDVDGDGLLDVVVEFEPLLGLCTGHTVNCRPNR
jgi:hypothetical protein